MLSSGLFTGVCGLNANISEQRVGTYPPVKKEQKECSETLAFKLQSSVNHPEEKVYSTQNTAKVLNKKLFINLYKIYMYYK
jgi:hypothetical protein